MSTRDPIRRLKDIIRRRKSMLIAYSGGVDSALLAVLARNILGSRATCVLLDSPVVPRSEIGQAKEIAGQYDLSLEIIPAPLMRSSLFRNNPPDRCYHCRKITSRILTRRAKELGLACVADGLNISDTGERRPGTRACDEAGIIHPFIEAGISKGDIRGICREQGLPFWDKPSAACLASRIPYGMEITRDRLRMAELAEEYLHSLGITQVRVRCHPSVARIEADRGGMETILTRKEEVSATLRHLGFPYVALDLDGYRSGSMDEVV